MQLSNQEQLAIARIEILTKSVSLIARLLRDTSPLLATSLDKIIQAQSEDIANLQESYSQLAMTGYGVKATHKRRNNEKVSENGLPQKATNPIDLPWLQNYLGQYIHQHEPEGTARIGMAKALYLTDEKITARFADVAETLDKAPAGFYRGSLVALPEEQQAQAVTLVLPINYVGTQHILIYDFTERVFCVVTHVFAEDEWVRHSMGEYLAKNLVESHFAKLMQDYGIEVRPRITQEHAADVLRTILEERPIPEDAIEVTLPEPKNWTGRLEYQRVAQVDSDRADLSPYWIIVANNPAGAVTAKIRTNTAGGISTVDSITYRGIVRTAPGSPTIDDTVSVGWDAFDALSQNLMLQDLKAILRCATFSVKE
jgi:hypothetical protein